MRVWMASHLHSVASFGAMLAIALLLGMSLGSATWASPAVAGVPSPPISIPSPADDRDLDTYADAVDLVEGDAHVRLSLERLEGPDITPYFLVGTQDDQWRMGAGRELEWRHIVDPDPLGHDIGSRGWATQAIRTGAWWYSAPMQGEDKVVSHVGNLGDEALPGVEWPQVFHVNVRDDTATVGVRIELMDARASPDRLVAAWDIIVDVPNGTWHHAGLAHPPGAAATAMDRGVALDLGVTVHGGLTIQEQTALAQRWSPEMRFSTGEGFFPTSGDALARFHGFSRTAPEDKDLRTWTRGFNNGRDGYVLLLADFTGDRVVDFRDAQVMTDVLREGGAAPDTIYAHVFDTTGDRVVVQYWFVYMYNFVQDESGDAIAALAHNGDREFVQLTFASRDDAMNGTPLSVAYSQHYRGIRIPTPSLASGPFGNNDTHLLVYPARGSHASYPAPGDDRKFRSPLAGYGDVFDGNGETWTATDYTLELLNAQEWSYGHLWGPPTRHSRDMGTSTKPFLQYAFRYPYIDPLAWEQRLITLDQDALADHYGGPR